MLIRTSEPLPSVHGTGGHVRTQTAPEIEREMEMENMASMCEHVRPLKPNARPSMCECGVPAWSFPQNVRACAAPQKVTLQQALTASMPASRRGAAAAPTASRGPAPATPFTRGMRDWHIEYASEELRGNRDVVLY